MEKEDDLYKNVPITVINGKYFFSNQVIKSFPETSAIRCEFEGLIVAFHKALK